LQRLQLDVEVIEGERPDFSLSFGRGALHAGLELTLLNADGPRSDGSPERRLHSMWKKVAEALRERLYKESEPVLRKYSAWMPILGNFERASFEMISDLRARQPREEEM
jgi:hypothetical protein